VERGDLVFVVLPFVALALFSIGFVALFRRRWRMDRAALRRAARLVEPDIVTPPRDPGRHGLPWWGNPWVWVGISAVSVVLGLVVWRGLFGGVFLFVPFVWLSRAKEPAVDPRSNGHARREDPF
jgi:apolipoprotein N-acyltransferase